MPKEARDAIATRHDALTARMKQTGADGAARPEPAYSLKEAPRTGPYIEKSKLTVSNPEPLRCFAPRAE